MISLSDLKRRIDGGELSPEAALAQSLAAIEAQEKTIGAFVTRAKNPRAASEGALRGIAVGIKDNIDTADMPTEIGSSIYKGWQPRADAPVVMMLKRLGATIAGKTTTTTFAALDPTATLNPRNHGHTPGGSSAGSAAAVAAGMVPLAGCRSECRSSPALARTQRRSPPRASSKARCGGRAPSRLSRLRHQGGLHRNGLLRRRGRL